MKLSICRGGAISLLAALVAGCVAIDHLSPPADTEAARMSIELGSEAAAFYAALGTKTAPDCAVDANRAGYAAMRTKAQALQARAAHDDRPMKFATAKVLEQIGKAERSHELASANTSDPFGACMAPGAIKIAGDLVQQTIAAVTNIQQARSN